MESTLTYEQDLRITPDIRRFLVTTAKWAKFLSIVGFVGVALMIVFALFAGTMMSSLSGMSGVESAVPATFMAAIYVVMGAVYAIPLYYLYKFANDMQFALHNNDQTYLSQSFEKLKSHYKFFGIMAAIFLGFYAVILVVALLFGGFAALG